MILPPDVVSLLSGTTTEDEWEVVLPLLTVDTDGYPRVCLLSRAEVEVRGTGLGCVIRGRRTTANLRRDGRALLVVVHDLSAHYVRLTLRRARDDEGSAALSVEFSIDDHEEDSRQTPLRAMTFLVTARVRESEAADFNEALLDRLSETD
ncbi:MAG: hypothetical protein JWO67_2206 [Streptosporangiaceae bacterium]|nr:hypothetical protein [Streptosporangiaceae bacterium]